ncbi:MAG: relaxase, partial [Ginsengibacter sp.]
LNETARQPYKARVQNIIDLAFLKKPQQSFQNFLKALEKEGINTVVRQNTDGIIYGITYVDHKTKCVFNGSIIGKQYSAKGVIDRCSEINKQPQQKQNVPQPLSPKIFLPEAQEVIAQHTKTENNFLETLFQLEFTSAYVPYQLRKKGAKKRKKRVDKRI